MSNVLHLSAKVIYELHNPIVVDIYEHYGSRRDEIADEIITLVEIVTHSNICKLGLETMMCFDELMGAEFSNNIWWVVDNLRTVEKEQVFWYDL